MLNRLKLACLHVRGDWLTDSSSLDPGAGPGEPMTDKKRRVVRPERMLPTETLGNRAADGHTDGNADVHGAGWRSSRSDRAATMAEDRVLGRDTALMVAGALGVCADVVDPAPERSPSQHQQSGATALRACTHARRTSAAHSQRMPLLRSFIDELKTSSFPGRGLVI